MNNQRIIAGGLLAGLVLNIGETILNIPVVGKDFEAAMTRLNLPATMSGGTIGMFVVLCFLLGILAVWLYAAVRPRLGAGPKTAFTVGVVVWALAFVFPNIGVMAMGLFPTRLVMTALIWEAVEVPLAVMAGAWAYAEAGAPATAAAAQQVG